MRLTKEQQARKTRRKRELYATSQEYRDQVREQNKRSYAKRRLKLLAPVGTCPICERESVKLYKDHCHTTGLQRDLICNNCNLILGLAYEKPNVLRKAADYLERFRASVENNS